MVAPDVLVILDGASEPLDGARLTSLELARTPALDALARGGELSRIRTVPAGLHAGSEVAIPVLLGWIPPGPVDRAAIEAAAHGIFVPTGARPWRIDVLDADGRRADAVTTRRAASALQAGTPAHLIHQLVGHRLLLVGVAPLPTVVLEPNLRMWPDGEQVPRTLDETTVVVAARGAGAGVAALMGARVVVPDGATGGPDTHLAAKAAAAIAVVEQGGAEHLVVHVGGADEAAHALDRAAKVAFLERADNELIAPLAAAVGRAGGTLRVCPDHGCDPATGEHDAHPVPCVTWHAPGDPSPDSRRRLTERSVAELPVTDLTANAMAVA